MFPTSKDFIVAIVQGLEQEKYFMWYAEYGKSLHKILA